MEALSAAAHDDNPSSVKSDDSSPRRDSGSSSPPPNCAICLGTCKNKSFTDSCLHQFCFSCLLTWSKVKAECPLCKQAFRSIIHNVRSNHQYEEYLVVQRQNEESNSRIDIDSVTAATRRFRYRTTLTLPRRETIAIQQLLLHYPLMANVYPPPAARRRRSPIAFRRTVYRHNLWARPLPDFTGRFRDCSPDFYRYNDTQMHRLVPWLNRELVYLLNENVGHISYVMSRILELLPQHHINSGEFREALQRYFGERTEHFLHELYCFASTPYDMTGYDRNVQYTTDSRISTMVNEVISSSDSDATVDSDVVVMVSGSDPPEPPPGPSGLPAPVYPQNYISQPVGGGVIPIETISHSDTDDDSSEVMVVGYIKPPQERTPEVVDLLGSDSDVIVQDAPQPPPPAAQPRPAVKLTLKRRRPRDAAAADSDSDDSSYTPPLRLRRRPRSAASPGSSLATASRSTVSRSTASRSVASPGAASLPTTSRSTASRSIASRSIASLGTASLPTTSRSTTSRSTASRSTASPGTASPSTASRSTASPGIASPATATPGPADTSRSADSTPSPSPITGWGSSTTSGDSSGDESFERRPGPTERSKKRSNKARGSSRDRRRSKKRSLRSNRREKKRRQGSSEKDKRSKRKSRSGEGVKSLKKISVAPAPASPEAARAGTSGEASGRRRKPGERRRRRDSRETAVRRLRSVVNVMYNNKNTGESSSSGNHNNLVNNTKTDNELTPGVSESRVQKTECPSDESETRGPMRACPDSSDSADDLPLNLTLQKICQYS